MDREEIKDKVASLIARETGAATVRVENVQQMTGGASRETWSLDATVVRSDGEERLALVLRSDPVGGVISTLRSAEYELLAAAHEQGVPVPKPYFLGAASLGLPFFLMERVDGETLARRLLRDPEYEDARENLTGQLGAALARIHAIPREKYGGLGLPETPAGVVAAAAELAGYEETYREIAPEPHLVFELAFRWLKRRLPESDERTLVHGDFRIGNVIFGPEGLRSILDWELAHVGDPMEDLGWICVRSWRFGGNQPVGGIGAREDFFGAYEEAGGRTVDPKRVRFWEVFGNLRWGIICINQAKTYLDGRSGSVELAAIGRRTVETEVELMRIMGEENAG